MNFLPQKIAGAFIIEPTSFCDDRGIFRRHFCKNEFATHEIVSEVLQANVSENPYAFTLRGFHYQSAPHAEGKTLSCLKGAIYDVIVDLRIDSPTYMDWISIELNDENRRSIHIPPGCANAFLTLKDNCLIHYYCSQSYAPEMEKGIRFDDPNFSFCWPHVPLVISDKDRSHPDYLTF